MHSFPVLLVGGYGVTGKDVAQLLRARHPDLAIAIAGRDLHKAEAFAAEVGALPKAIDLTARVSGLEEMQASAVVALAKDACLHGMAWAQARGIPYISLSSAAFEHGVDVAHALAGPQTAPVVLASHWFAGVVVASALSLSARFNSIQSIVAGVTIDSNGIKGGPASVADFQRIARSTQATLARVNGAYVWETEAESRRLYRNASGEFVEGKGSVSLDVASIGASADAPNVRVLETWGTSHHYALTGIPADEVSVEVAGSINGAAATGRQVLSLPRSVTSLTALGIVLALERTLGLDGDLPAKLGLYSPELLIAPDIFISRLQDAGVKVETTLT